MTPGELSADAAIMAGDAFARRYAGFWLVISNEEGGAPLGFQTAVIGPGTLPETRRRADSISEALQIKKAPGNPYPDRISIGRARNCDVVLRDASVSKLHAHARLIGDTAVEIMDVGSANGTFLAGRALRPSLAERILPGDNVQFGAVSAVLCDGAMLYDLVR